MNRFAEHLHRWHTSGYIQQGTCTLATPDSLCIPRIHNKTAASLAKSVGQTIVIGPSPLPMAGFLVRRAGASTQSLRPRDSETQVFLEDIPVVDANDLEAQLKRAFSYRQAALLNTGELAVCGPTIDRCGLLLACLHHALFVTYLVERLDQGAKLPDENAQLKSLIPLAKPIPFSTLPDDTFPSSLDRAGKALVNLGLVDSVFGNASYRQNDQIRISRTGAPLDDLEKSTVEVSLHTASNTDKKASSELPAHRAIYQQTAARVILHGHPRFSIAASLSNSFNTWPEDVPSIEAAPGSQELGERLAKALQAAPVAMADGHGPFAAGKTFGEALHHLIRLENHCRQQILEKIELSVPR